MPGNQTSDQKSFTVCPTCLEGLLFVQTGTTRHPDHKVYQCPKCKRMELVAPEKAA